MATQYFSDGKEFLWRGEPYRVTGLLPGSYVSIENMATRAVQTVFFLDLIAAVISDEIQWLQQDQPMPLPERYTDLSDCPPHLRERMAYRLEVIRPLLTNRSVAAIKARVAEYQTGMANGEKPVRPISQGSVYRWLHDYIASGEDIRSLLGNSHKQGGKDQTRMNPDLEAIITAVIQDHFYVRTRVSVDDLYQEVCLRVKEANEVRSAQDQLPRPSRATVGRRLAAQDTQGKVTAKRGRREAQRIFTQYGAMHPLHRPLERVEIDHTTSDIVVVDDNDLLPLGRLTLTFATDVLTRYPLGFYLGFEPPSYLTVMECLYHVILPKGDVRQKYSTEHEWLACGVPSTLVIDNGKEFIGRDLQDACVTLGTILEPNPKRCPHLKPMVERMFGTLNTGLFHTLPGTTFANIVDRGDYNSLKHACLTLDELDQIVVKFLVDVYAESWHRGLDRIPARRWQSFIEAGFFPKVPAKADDLRIILGRVTERTIRRDGIEFESLRYNGPELVSLRTRFPRQKLKVKYHPADLSCLHVYDPDAHIYLTVPALDQAYAQGLSLWKHKVIRRFIRMKQLPSNPESLAQAKREIQEMVASSMRRQKVSARRKIGRWNNSGKTRSLRKQTLAAGDSDAAQPALPTGSLLMAPAHVTKPIPPAALSSQSLPDLTYVDPQPSSITPCLPEGPVDWHSLDAAGDNERSS